MKNENHPDITGNQDFYKLLLEDTLAGYWDRNFKENTGYLSPAFKEMLGYTDEEMHASLDTWESLIFPEDLENLMTNFEQHVKSHGQIPHRTEVRYRHKDGSTVWVLAVGRVVEWDKDGQPIRMIGCHVDITRQKEVEEELKISEKQFKGAFENSSIGMALVSLDGRWMRVNKQLAELLGYTEDEMHQTTFQQLTHPDDLDLDLNLLYEVLDGKRNHYQIEKRYYHKKGGVIWGQLNVSLVNDSQGKPLHFVSQIQVITKRKLAQKNLEALTEKLTLRNQKLGDFAHIASHNLRAPVSNLTTLVNMYKKVENIEEKDLVFSNFKKVVNHLSSTLSDLINSLKIQGDFDQIRQDVYFEEVLTKTREILTAQIEETGTEINFDFSAAPKIKFHIPYLESIFLNLVTNAIKYRSPDRSPVINLKSENSKGGVFLKISDNGLGINLKRHGHKIFGLHKTFHRHKEAKGVGLFMTKAQVDAMGGHISVESTEGEGTTFTIHF